MNSRQPSGYPALIALVLAVLPPLVYADDFLSPGLSPDELLARLDTTTALGTRGRTSLSRLAA